MKRYEKVKNQEQKSKSKSKSRAKIKIKSKNQEQELTFSSDIRLVASMIKCTNEDTRLRLVQG